MNLTGKSFRNIRTGQVVSIIDTFEDIAIATDRSKLSAQSLMDPGQYVEHIDPNKFFNNPSTFNTFAEKIKAINLDNVKENYPSDIEIPMNESAVIGYGDPEEEKLELMRKYQNLGFDNSAIQRQQELLSGLTEDSDPNQPVVKPYRPQQPNSEVVVSPNQTAYDSGTPPVQRVDVQDPVTQMFRSVKRSVDIDLDLKVKGKIPRLDFIEMMEDSYEISIIDFLAEEFTRQILNDPAQLRRDIKSKIEKMINSNPQKQDSNDVPVMMKTGPVKGPTTRRKKETKPVDKISTEENG